MSEPRRALLVTLGRSRGSLAAVRALAAAGWVVGVGTPTGDGMVSSSWACQFRHRVPRPRGDGEAFVTAVRRAIDERGYDVTFGGADDWMAALAIYRDALSARIAHPDGPVVAAALDKLGLVERARAVGLDAPETVVADPATVAAWQGPVVVKCRSHWFPGQRRDPRIEARCYPGVQQAAGRIRLIQREGFEAVLQRPVDGQLSALIGLFADGRLHGRVQQVTSGLWPTPSGVSSRAETVAVDEDLAERCEDLLGGLGWHGLVELQFLTSDGGAPQLIDLNGRFYGSMALAVAAGPNLPDAWGRWVLGDPVPPLPDGRPGVRYLWAAGDLRRALVERRGGLLTDVWSTFRWGRGAATSVWDPRDRGPAMDLLKARALRRVSASS